MSKSSNQTPWFFIPIYLCKLLQSIVLYGLWCVWYVKDTNSKANHNDHHHYYCIGQVCLICQRYKFKSKSQRTHHDVERAERCVWYVKDTNSKANHNHGRGIKRQQWGVFDMSKIQIQKQITTIWRAMRSCLWCVWYVKDTNSKANHNATLDNEIHRRVCLICQRYKFKSKSQLTHRLTLWRIGVFDMSKIQIQKQITT